MAKLAQEAMLEQLSVYLEAQSADYFSKANKGLLLYSQMPDLLRDTDNLKLIFDQIPFTAALMPQKHLKAMLPVKQYQILLSNLAFDWVDAGQFIHLMQGLLAPEGSCWFSAYGPQTAARSRAVLAKLDHAPHFNTFYTLQEIGDALLGVGFREVVVESKCFTLEYSSVEVLMADANKIFGANLHPRQRKTLSSKRLLNSFSAHVEQVIQNKGKYVETVEIIVAHAKAPVVTQIIPVTVT